MADPALGASERAAPTLLELEELTVRATSRAGTVTPVDGLSFQVAGRETVALVGDPGSGKRVAMHALLGLERGRHLAITGSARYQGEELVGLDDRALRSLRGKEIALVPSDPANALTATRTVGRQIAEQLRAHAKLSRSATGDRVLSVLAEVGIADPRRCADSRPRELSLPTLYRALVAMAFSCGPRVVVVDWPARELDAAAGADLLELLRREQEIHGCAYVLTTRDLAIASEIADRVVVLYAGRPVETGPAAAVAGDPQHPYTWSLVAASVAPPGAPSALLAAPRPISLLDIPAGCAYGPRCSWRFSSCDVRPPLTVYGAHRDACWLEPRDRARLRAGALEVPGDHDAAGVTDEALVVHVADLEPDEPDQTSTSAPETGDEVPEEPEERAASSPEPGPEDDVEDRDEPEPEPEPEDETGETGETGETTEPGEHAPPEMWPPEPPRRSDAVGTAEAPAVPAKAPTSATEGDAAAGAASGGVEDEATPRGREDREWQPPPPHGFLVEPIPAYPGPTDAWPAEYGPAGAWPERKATSGHEDDALPGEPEPRGTEPEPEPERDTEPDVPEPEPEPEPDVPDPEPDPDPGRVRDTDTE